MPKITSQSVFEGTAKIHVCNYANEHLDKSTDYQIQTQDVYIVWMCKILQHFKALLSTKLPDGMYYEVTYNGDKEEIYVDAYKKFENRCYDSVTGLIKKE